MRDKGDHAHLKFFLAHGITSEFVESGELLDQIFADAVS